ncbi:hypothetical protein JTB14_001618 [Gonioctena quinquepunctata]|nr:hypothetical protein JTB14_001618 [Gonioctena quinquepunctata]
MSTTVLEENLLETLKCSLCNKYLSLPPVSSISYDGIKQKCGRCREVRTEFSVRNITFENLAVTARFPCIYPDCKTILKWVDVGHHEDFCSYKTMTCPIFWICEKVIKISDLEVHFRENHDASLDFEYFSEKEIEFDQYMTSLLICGGVPYLVARCTTETSFWFQVFSLFPNENYEYELKLCSKTSDELCLLFKSHVVFFNERSHCFPCAVGKCREKSHPNSTLYKKRIPRSETALYIDPSFAKSALKSDTFQSTIIIKKDGESVEDEMVLKGFISKNNTRLIKNLLRCPVCEDYMSPPIFTCNTGHTMCNICKPRITKCPTCEAPFGTARNFALEEASESVELPCLYATEGCNFIGNVNRIIRHHSTCCYKNESISENSF